MWSGVCCAAEMAGTRQREPAAPEAELVGARWWTQKSIARCFDWPIGSPDLRDSNRVAFLRRPGQATFPNTRHHGVLFLNELTEFRARFDFPRQTRSDAGQTDRPFRGSLAEQDFRPPSESKASGSVALTDGTDQQRGYEGLCAWVRRWNKWYGCTSR